jgi:hypothetical protein
MRLHRARFTIKRIMAVAAVVAVCLAVILVLELHLFHRAAEEARSGDQVYIRGEAVMSWVFLNALPSIPIAVVVLIERAALNERAEAERRKGRALTAGSGPGRRN